MIATTLAGGIGNQLFMYAAAQSLALDKGTQLVLNTDDGFVNDYQFHRNYELDNFNIHYKTNRFLTFNYKGGERIKNLSRKYGLNILCPLYTFLGETTYNKGIDNRFFEIKSRYIYIEGYWQSEKYFHNHTDYIRKELSFNFKKSDSLLKESANILSQKNNIPVCVGVRRYQECVNKPSFGVVEADFYIEAMNYMISKLPILPYFYIFSQDVDWVKKNIIPFANCPIKIMDEHTTIEDLYLMSLFKYHIISNSSFYWWGARLANGNLVVSTKQFINKDTNLPDWYVI